MFVMNDQNQLQLISNQDNNDNMQAQSINLLNNQPQLQIRPSANYQLLPNGQLCSTGDTMTNTMGQIIISQPFLNQPTSAIVLPNGQILNVLQNQPNLIFNPNSGLMLQANTLVNNQSATTGANQTQPNSLTTQLNSLNSTSSSATTGLKSINSTTNAIQNSTVITTNANSNVTFTSSNLPQITTSNLLNTNINTSFSNQQTNKQTKNKKVQNAKQTKKNTTIKEKPIKNA